jgi:hypothetical protein
VSARREDDPVNGAARRNNRMIGVPGRPEDVAALAFLASEQSAFMTAAMVPLDGRGDGEVPGTADTDVAALGLCATCAPSSALTRLSVLTS